MSAPVSQGAREAAVALLGDGAWPAQAERFRSGTADDDHYVQTLAAFEATARKQALEEAAKVAEAQCYKPPTRIFHRTWNDAVDHAAAAIRALGSQNDG